jgi:hypothetical protein
MPRWPIKKHPNTVMVVIAIGLGCISIGIVGLIEIGSDLILIGVDSGFDGGFDGGLFN